MKKNKAIINKIVIGITFIFMSVCVIIFSIIAYFSIIDFHDEYKFKKWSANFIDSPAPSKSTILYKEGFWDLSLGGNSETTYFSVQWILESEEDQKFIEKYYNGLISQEDCSEGTEVLVDNYKKNSFDYVCISIWVNEQKDNIKPEDHSDKNLYVVAIMRPYKIDAVA